MTKTLLSLILIFSVGAVLGCGTTEPEEPNCQESIYGFQECRYTISAGEECYFSNAYGAVRVFTTFSNGQADREIYKGEKRRLWVPAEGMRMAVVGQVQEGSFRRTIWADTLDIQPGGEYVVRCP